MRDRRRVWAVLALAALLVGAGQSVEQPDVQFVDLADYPTTRLVFTPPLGLRDADLAPDEISLSLDGQPVEFTMQGLEADPVEAVLLIDTSGSMAGSPMAAAKDAAIDFVGILPPDSAIAVVAFGSTVRVVADFGSDTTEVVDAIESLTASGDTSLYDAVQEGMALVEEGPETRQFVVLLSDGADTVSGATLDGVLERLGSIEVGFYAVGLEGTEWDPAILDQMAEASGGRVVPASEPATLAGVFAEIAHELVSQYELEFTVSSGGSTTFTLVVDAAGSLASTSFTIDLPAVPTAPSQPGGQTATDPMPPIEFGPRPSITPPATRIVGPPTGLQQDWAKVVGIGALFAVFLMAFGLALRPQEDGMPRRRGARDLTEGARDPFTSGGGRVSRLTGRLQDGIERIMRRRTPGRSRIDLALDAAGVALRPGEFVLLSLVGAFVGFLLGSAIGSPGLGILLAAAAFGGPRAWLSSKTGRRRSQFADQLEGTLQLIAGSLRAGYGVRQAINTVANESSEPTRSEFSRVVVEVRLGRELDDAMDALADRMDNRDLRWVNDAIEIQRNVGGDLAEVLDTVGSTIRDRNQIRRQVQALTAEGRMSAIILIGLPFALAGFISLTNPGYLSELFTTVPGRVMLLGGAVLMTIGVVWIRKLIRIEF